MANRRPVVTDTVVTRKGASTGLQDLYKGFKKLARTGVIQTKSLQSDVENNYIYSHREIHSFACKVHYLSFN